ncbi:MAG: DUF2294 domain-containing protein [Thermoleophilaceae bacterium]|jgi:uncharacterized protein YbcI
MTSTASRGQVAAAISNAIVGIHSKHYGKGPTKAKTYLVDDVVITVMQDVFTTVERTLIEHEKADLVREVRTAFQFTLRDEFKEAIGEIVGRDVRGFISQIDCDADIAVEVFLLANGVTDVTQDHGAAS